AAEGVDHRGLVGLGARQQQRGQPEGAGVAGQHGPAVGDQGVSGRRGDGHRPVRRCWMGRVASAATSIATARSAGQPARAGSMATPRAMPAISASTSLRAPLSRKRRMASSTSAWAVSSRGVRS
ncbi:MAG: hypothetical protein ACK559_34585, partial [bacterium]